MGLRSLWLATVWIVACAGACILGGSEQHYVIALGLVDAIDGGRLGEAAWTDPVSWQLKGGCFGVMRVCVIQLACDATLGRRVFLGACNLLVLCRGTCCIKR